MKYKKRSIQLGCESYKEYYSKIEALANFFVHNYESSTAKQKYQAYKALYSIDISDEEYLEILNDSLKSNFTKIVRIDTQVEYVIEEIEKRYREYYECAAKEDFEVSDKKYSEKELKALIKEGIVVPLMYDSYRILKCSKNAKHKKYDIKCYEDNLYYTNQRVFDDDDNFQLSASGDTIDSVSKFLDEKIGKEVAIEDLKKIIFAFYSVLDNHANKLINSNNQHDKYRSCSIRELSRKTLDLIKID